MSGTTPRSINLDGRYSLDTHNHSGVYATASHTHSNQVDNVPDTYVTTSRINHIVTITQSEYNNLSTPAYDTMYVIIEANALP